MTGRTRLTLDVYTAGAVEDALSYYLMASADNFGAGYPDDVDTADQLREERSLVVAFLDRIIEARDRMSS